ncbi:hypothetical protein FOC84_05940 [Achromobacter pestifer]|uniref:Uncharacterized protein n=1 Tax=Achromobacter pestifer TaxID=1353889 RepID=A0A7D4HXP9_9BURK|nr:hypothetical protein [Achromobacter pestifer]QKH34518.1 hypothetical protein FOC84_05940 [Achromobacter pestifer]
MQSVIDGIDTFIAHLQNSRHLSQLVHIPMANSKLLLLFLVGGLLSGCSSVKIVSDYSGPSDAVSTIRFSNLSAHGVAAGKFVESLTCDGTQFLQGANAPAASIGIAIENRGRRERYIGLQPGDLSTFTVERGKPLTVFGWAMTVSSIELVNCRVQVTFVPKEPEYQVAFRTTSGLSKCGFTFETAAGEPAAGVSRSYVAGGVADGPYCTALSEAEKRQLGL